MRFAYLRDPLFLTCAVLYVLNRCVLKELHPSGFYHSYLNDLICIPFWVPLMLWLMRRTGLRDDDGPPRWYEIIVPLVLWAYVFEVQLPNVPTGGRPSVADPVDVLCYTLGALLAA